MIQVKLTYENGMEVFDTETMSNAMAIRRALRLSNLKDRKSSCYRKVIKAEILAAGQPHLNSEETKALYRESET